MQLSRDPAEETLRRALADRYQLEGLLGRGGMGVVYLARDLRLERSVAIKVPPPDRTADPDFRERFLREARTAAALAHPNIVPIYAVEEAGDFILFAMAYVAGETLARRVSRDGPLPPDDAARLLGELADALAYAHARGVVHRDVKPDNILLDGATGRALLSDFGIARVSQDGGPVPASSGGLFGTAAFMSPEQSRGDQVDARSDLYSLGVVGYYALTGRLPFVAETDAAMFAMHWTTPPPPIDAPGIPRRLVQAIERCLAKEPVDRFTDGAALGRAIAAAVPDQARLPIAVRAFLTRSAHLGGPALLYEACVGLLIVPGALWCWLHPELGLVPVSVVVLLAALLLPLVVAWGRARRLLADGHGWEELVEALIAERDRHQEELRFLYGSEPSGFEWTMRWLCGVALTLAAAGSVAIILRPPLGQPRVLAACLVGAGVSLLAAAVARARYERRTDPRGRRRLRFWAGALGRWLFRAAAIGLQRAPEVAEFPSLETPA